MKFFGSTKKLIDTTKNGENVPSLQVVEIFGHCNLADNQYQQKYEMLYNFTPNKSYGYLLNTEPNNSVFFYNTYDIIITFTDQNGRSSEI